MNFADNDIVVVGDQALFANQITDKFALNFVSYVVYTPEDENYWDYFFDIEE